MDVTQVIRRDRAMPTGPPSLRAQVLLILSAFLCGTVLSGLLFVGIWRHTADDGARAHASQVASQRQLAATKRKIASLDAALAQSKHSATTAATRAARERTALAHAIASNAALARALPPRLATLTASAHALEAQLTTLQSELKTLASYVDAPGSTGLDAGYLAAQIEYLTSAAKSAVGTAATISQKATDAGASLSTITRRN